MNIKSILLIIFALAIVFGGDDPAEKMTGVVELDNLIFDKFVDGSKFALVEFYAPWCGHCKHLAPEYKKLGEAIANDPYLSSRVIIAKVNADSDRDLGSRFGISGFPTLKYFKRGSVEPNDYSGARQFDGLLQFVKDQVMNDNVGRVEVLDNIAKEFIKDSDKTKYIKSVEDAKSELKEDEVSYADVYIKIMNKVISDGPEYITKEHERINKLLQSKSISQKKMPDMIAKLNILDAFKSEE